MSDFLLRLNQYLLISIEPVSFKVRLFSNTLKTISHVAMTIDSYQHFL